MAKRTKLTAPSADELAALDADFRSESRARPNPATAPIAQVAADAASLGTGEPAQAKLDRLDAEVLRDAKKKGLFIAEIPTDQIDDEAMIRDREELDERELNELKFSIRANGLRMPIEVYENEKGGFNLISGYRRLAAVRGLAELNPTLNYDVIAALVRPPQELADAVASMVEENEIRSSLSHYERGRVAVLAAHQGVFENTEAAISKLFHFGSAAKRSKIKSFAEVFEFLGDVLSFPNSLSERRGLRLANALKQGAEGPLRAALGAEISKSPEEEWAIAEAIIKEVEDGPVKIARRGRKKLPPAPGWEGKDTLHLSSGISLRKERDSHGYVIRLQGRGLNEDVLDAAMEQLRHLFEAPK